MAATRAPCDLHVHSIHSRDSGNFAVRRAARRRTAELLDGEYRELDPDGRYMWMLDSCPQLARLL